MREVKVNLGPRSYTIYIGTDLAANAQLYKNLVKTDQVLVVTDSNIESMYLKRVMEALNGFQSGTYILPPGEEQKNLTNLNQIITELLTRRFSKTGCLIALGGGVVGDLTGFVAACYQRGIQFLQVPTTLLAQVDSSVGGKTAVNHPMGKNMIGAFHQPCGVIADVGVLKSLPDREFKAGVAEVIKYGLIRDAHFFTWLEENIDELLAQQSYALEFSIERSCINKAEVVAEDETEKGIRAILNLGHTFGHAIETSLEYTFWLHGEAVGLGMIMASYMSNLMGWISDEDYGRIVRLIQRAGLPNKLPDQLQNVDLRDLMSVDKKVSHGKLKLVLLKSIGEAVVTDSFDEDVLTRTINTFR
ncbi:MAG: 3-dehydroquinate synthase [Gammaproteobacteria bacterium]|nr:3-dehydroquinate synthase [Gammaproteobacteria bacterium]